MAKKIKLESEATLRSQIRAKIRGLGELGIFISGSFVHTERKCGSKSCACASGGPKHPCCLLTSKVAGKTKSVYVPVDLAEEVAAWSAEHKRLKKLLKEIDQLGERLIRTHVAARERHKANAARAEQGKEPSNP
jgi:hypothetical protein